MCDVYKTLNGVARYAMDGETESDYAVRDVSIKKNGEGYSVRSRV